MTINGDIYHYSELPFRFQPEKSRGPNNLLEQINNLAYQDKGDHLELLGFNILNFDIMARKLEEQKEFLSAFKGFSPRWILPAKVRRLDTSARNTSATVIIIDSAREV